MNKLGLVWISVLLIFLFLIPTINHASSYSFSATASWLVSPSYVAPGEKLVPLQVSIVYNGPYTLYNVYIKPIENSLISPFFSNTTYELNEMIPGQQYTLVFLVSVSPTIGLGIYNFYLSIYNATTVFAGFETSPVTVTVPVLGYVALMATVQSQSELFPGEVDVPLDITVFNMGTVSASNVTLFLTSSYPVNFITKEVKIPEIPAGSSYTVQALADIYNNATIGNYNVRITALVFGSLTQSLNLSIAVNSNETVEGKILNPTIVLGSGPYQNDVTFNLDLEYIGPVEADSYSVVVNLPSGFYNTTGGKEIIINGGTIEPQQIVVLPISLNIKNATLSSYSIPAKIVWNAVEGNGAIVSVVQYATFNLILTGNPIIQIVPSTSLLYSNSINNLTLIINNIGTGNIYNASFSVSSSVGSILSYVNQISEIKAGQSVKIPIQIYVPQSLSTLQLEVELSYLNSVYQPVQYTQQLNFYVVSQTQLPLIVSLSQPILSPGTLQTAELEIQNTLNTTVYNVSITLSPSEVYVNNTVFQISSILPHSTYYVPIEVFSSQSGNYLVTATINYFDNAIEKEETVELPIYFSQINSPTVPILIKFNTTTITTDTSQNVLLLIENTLNIPLYNVSISLTPQSGLYVNATILNIPELKPLQTISVPVQIYSEATGTASISSTISYYISGEQREANELVNILSAGSVNIVITGTSVITANNIISVTATIYNFGTGSANGLTVVAFPVKGLQIIGQNTYYVGNLGPDTSSTFTFAFRLTSNQTTFKPYIIPIEFIYTNDIGQSLHSYSNITIHVSNITFSNVNSVKRTSSNFGSLLTVGIIIAIVVIVVPVLVLRRKGKKE